ncbi:MAG: fimbria/pilus periplasmic chaperone [Kofleriaceae bacterium]
MRARNVHATLAVLLAVLAATRGLARAGDFQVEPTRLDLVRQGVATELTITNRGHRAARFEVTVSAWAEDEQGGMRLAPAADLVVYPTLFAVEPGAKRSIRIATTAAPSALERPYRIFIEELPPRRGAGEDGAPASVTVRTRVAVPIFLASTRAVVRGAITGTVDRGAARLTIENRGTVHVKIATVRAIGRDRAGTPLFDRSLPSWYVLASSSRTYPLALAAGECAALDQLSIEAMTDRGIWRATIAKPRDGCQDAP